MLRSTAHLERWMHRRDEQRKQAAVLGGFRRNLMGFQRGQGLPLRDNRRIAIRADPIATMSSPRVFGLWRRGLGGAASFRAGPAAFEDSSRRRNFATGNRDARRGTAATPLSFDWSPPCPSIDCQHEKFPAIFFFVAFSEGITTCTTTTHCQRTHQLRRATPR